MRKRRVFLGIFGSIIVLLFFFQSMALASPAQDELRQEEGPLVLVLQADGPISPTMLEYLNRGLRNAERRGAAMLIFQINTPGGAIVIMNRFVETILASPVPVVVYVAPRGAMAGSAGTLITLAGHASAMAPETIIGAASPVGPQGEDLGETLAAKEKEALKATVRALAARRPAEAVKLAEATIESARAITAEEALEVGLVDFLAEDVNHLLRQLDGFRVQVQGKEQVLSTIGARAVSLPPSLIEGLLAVIANPNIVFLLIQLGVLAILIEISSPGGWVAGFIGVVCLALATYGLGILPVNWFGLVFLVTAFVLFVMEINSPTHGALTAAGAASLIVGALVLFNSPGVPLSLRVSPWLIIVTSALTAAGFGLLVTYAVRAQKVPAQSGLETMIGQIGIARSDLTPRGTVRVGAELWTAELLPPDEKLPQGAHVEVVQVDGFKLYVRKADES